MEKNDIAIWLSIIATCISILSFFTSSSIAVWKTWRERARLRFGISHVIQKNTDGKIFNQIEIKTTNIGFRPIILKSFLALGENALYLMGDNGPVENVVFV